MEEKVKKPRQKKETCHECKKKNKPITKLPPVEDDELYVPTVDEIRDAYFNLISMGGVKENNKEPIDKVFKFLFDEDFNWKCKSCVSSQVIKFTNHMRYVLKLLPE
jgi:hypothetical protein